MVHNKGGVAFGHSVNPLKLSVVFSQEIGVLNDIIMFPDY